MKKLLLLIVFGGLFLFSCSNDDSVENRVITDLTGNVQKGPFINGTAISLFELNSSISQTGKVFNTQLENNSGLFEINNLELISNFIEISATGYYFNEVRGDVSNGSLNLLALSDITNKSSINANVLTHLEKKRIEYLLRQGKSFNEAKKQAQGEILTIFGFTYSEMDNSESLDISIDNDGNAILLAISVILQGNLNAGELTELLANISGDIETDGTLDNTEIIQNLINSAKQINLTQVRTNLSNRYKEIGNTISIPNFENYITAFLDFTKLPLPIVETLNLISISQNSGMCSGNVINDNGFDVTSRGFCWGLNPNPTIENNFSVEGNGLGDFTGNLINLVEGSNYYVRAYATSSVGTSYGNDVFFPTIDFKNSDLWTNYDTENLYLTDSRNNLFKSSDNAESWEYLSNMNFNNKFQLEINGNDMYAGNYNNIFKSSDGGKNWESIKGIDENYPFTGYAIDKNSNDIYATIPNALYRFDGENWSRKKTTSTGNSSICVTVDDSGNVYYGVYLFTIHKSTNKGDDWSSIDYGENNQGRSTTGNMYVTDDNILLMNRWWDGVYWLSNDDCLPLNNGLPNGSVGTISVVAQGFNYYTVATGTEGVLGIYSSSDKGQEWINSSYNLSKYDLIKFQNISINKSGIVFISIKDKGIYKFMKDSNQWDLLL